MAVYLGEYTTDSDKVFKFVPLTVGFVEVTTGEIRGQFSQSNPADDARYIPPVWFNNVQAKGRRQNACSLPHTPRFALLWVTNTLYLRVPVPFRPGTGQYDEFFTSLAFAEPKQLVSVGQLGEQVSSNWLKVYIK
jgi:hypothetical protein